MAANAADACCLGIAATLQSLDISTDPAGGHVDITAWGSPFRVGSFSFDMATCVPAH